MSELTRRLKAVDPDLKVVPGGVRRRTHRTTKVDWENCAGVVCKSCNREVFRSRDGLCMRCWENENEFEIRDKTGVLSLLPKSVIMDIVHPSRREDN